jgi:hypothetical protein
VDYAVSPDLTMQYDALNRLTNFELYEPTKAAMMPLIFALARPLG